MRYTKPYGKKNIYITGNLNSVVEKYQTQSIISYLPAVGDSEGALRTSSDFFIFHVRVLSTTGCSRHTQKVLEGLPIAVGDWH